MVTNFFIQWKKYDIQEKNTPLWHYETYQFRMEIYLLDPARPVEKTEKIEK
jgi:hypothetical protein